MKHGSQFARIDPIERSDRPDAETVGIAIEIMGLKSAPQIAVWVADELRPDIKADAILRAGIVDALQDFINRMAGVQ